MVSNNRYAHSFMSHPTYNLLCEYRCFIHKGIIFLILCVIHHASLVGFETYFLSTQSQLVELMSVKFVFWNNFVGLLNFDETCNLQDYKFPFAERVKNGNFQCLTGYHLFIVSFACILYRTTAWMIYIRISYYTDHVRVSICYALHMHIIHTHS